MVVDLCLVRRVTWEKIQRYLGVTLRFNPWIGCKPVSEACVNCYARRENERFGWVKDFNTYIKRTSKEYWTHPELWNKSCKRHGTRKRVFCSSLADVFDDRVPGSWRNELFSIMENTEYLDWLILTKRPQNIHSMVKDSWLYYEFPQNVSIGITGETQQRYDERSQYLSNIKCNTRFVSIEPILGTVLINPSLTNWVIIGGESGDNARISMFGWIKNTLNNTKSLNVPIFFKQWGEWIPDDMLYNYQEKGLYTDKEYKILDDGIRYIRLGKKNTGDKISGKQYHNFPKALDYA